MEIVNKILEDLGLILRHIISGIPILIALYCVNPEMLISFECEFGSYYIIVIAVIGVALGNLAYSANRMGLISILEAFIYFIVKFEVIKKCWNCILPLDYAKRVKAEIYSYYRSSPDNNKDFKALIKWRDSASIYMLIAAQSIGLIIYQNPSSLVNYMGLLIVLCVLLVIIAFWSYLLSRLLVVSRIETGDWRFTQNSQ
ncbi:hypothetical protein CH371_19845 [Leptospira wolffii]|uniref:Uncharacterized protein n=1 Tax=Leptospira wolffii TaxID=409998 RepID=A0A2M9Z6R2_9LEPT|nr:hypothetical protein [Leptospira wolffii]PJZ64119.1 hypothetical protein CH371_19845 [Leptospira wolffii]